MPKHKTTSKNLFEKIDPNNVMVNKWDVLGVDANKIYCRLCWKPVPINHGGMEQVNQHVLVKPMNLSQIQSFQALNVDSSKVLQEFNLPDQSMFR